MANWLEHVLTIVGALAGTGLFTWWLNRALNRATVEKVDAEAESVIGEALKDARQEAKDWFDKWQAEVRARVQDREAYEAQFRECRLRIEKMEQVIEDLRARLAANGLSTNGDSYE